MKSTSKNTLKIPSTKKKDETSFASNIAKLLDGKETSIAEDIMHTFIFNILPDNNADKDSPSLKDIELIESLNIFNMLKLTPDLFKMGILHNCEKLLENLKTLGSSNRQQNSEKLINAFIKVIEIIDHLNPATQLEASSTNKSKNSTISTQSKQLLQYTLKEIEKLTTQRHIKKYYFKNQIKPLLLDEVTTPEPVEKFLEQIICQWRLKINSEINFTK